MDGSEIRRLVTTFYQERLAPSEANWDILTVCVVASIVAKAQREQDASTAEACSGDEMAQRIANRIRGGTA